MTNAADVTGLLLRLANGDKGAEAELMPAIYGKLEQIAQNYLNRERRNHTLQPAALVNEAYLRLAHAPAGPWSGRTHFFAVCARIMRQILTDYARQRNALKRLGNQVQIALDVELLNAPVADADLVLTLDVLLNKLAEFAPRQASVVELRFYAGMSMEDIAEHLEITLRTAHRDWKCAKAWLWGEYSKSHQERVS